MTIEKESHNQEATATTDFGFKTVEEAKKKHLVEDVFNSVASKYDIMNDLMSAGIHHIWKDRLVDHITNLDGRVLDVAGGTGDIGLRIIKKGLKHGKSPHVIITDINHAMLREGKNKAIDKNLFKDVEFINSDAEQLPFADNSFDYYTISFGIRNVTDRAKALKEAYRVLKPGGQFFCLEFSKIDKKFASLYDLFSFNVIPKIGGLIAGDEASYQYLVESIRKFPDQESWKEMIQDAGFNNVSYDNYSAGIAALHYGYKL